jgi:hypothetical protein
MKIYEDRLAKQQFDFITKIVAQTGLKPIENLEIRTACI